MIGWSSTLARVSPSYTKKGILPMLSLRMSMHRLTVEIRMAAS